MVSLHLATILAYADMLSWTPESAHAAEELYRRALWLDPGNQRAGRGLRSVQAGLRRSSGSFVELSGGGTERSGQLDARHGRFAVSVALARQIRLVGEGEVVRFEDATGRLNARRGGLLLHGGPLPAFGFHVGMRRWDGAGADGWDGAAGVEVRRARVGVVAGFDRRLVDETRESVGQGVRANLASMEVRVRDLPARFDLVGRAAFGAYTGSGLASNRRAGLEGEVGWVVLTYRPWVRVGYGARSASFRYNAASGFAAAPDSAGGYFSPDRYVAHLGLVQMSHRFGRWVQWSVDARGGAEIVRQRAGEASDTRGAAVLVSEATFLLGAQMDVGLRYLYVDAFDVFRMHQAALLLRRHF